RPATRPPTPPGQGEAPASDRDDTAGRMATPPGRVGRAVCQDRAACPPPSAWRTRPTITNRMPPPTPPPATCAAGGQAPAEAAAHDAGDRVTQRPEVVLLQQAARDITARGPRHQLNDQVDNRSHSRRPPLLEGSLRRRERDDDSGSKSRETWRLLFLRTRRAGTEGGCGMDLGREEAPDGPSAPSEAGVEHPAGRDLAPHRAALVGADARLLQIEAADHGASPIAVPGTGQRLRSPRDA